MIHRGTQYSRAIRRYVKKTGRYPSRLEELENTNNIRFLRKRYKDPITGKDFKLLHVGEVQLTGQRESRGSCHRRWLDSGRIAAGRGHCQRFGAGGSQRDVAGRDAEPRCDPGELGLDNRGLETGAAGASDAADNSGDGGGQAAAGTPNQSSDQSGNDSKTVPPIPAREATNFPARFLAAGRLSVLPASARRRAFANSTTRTTTTSGNLFMTRPWIAAGLITTPAQPAVARGRSAFSNRIPLHPETNHRNPSRIRASPSGIPSAECRVRRLPSLHNSNNNCRKLLRCAHRGGEPSRVIFMLSAMRTCASMIRAISITPIHCPLRLSE